MQWWEDAAFSSTRLNVALHVAQSHRFPEGLLTVGGLAFSHTRYRGSLCWAFGAQLSEPWGLLRPQPEKLHL